MAAGRVKLPTASVPPGSLVWVAPWSAFFLWWIPTPRDLLASAGIKGVAPGPVHFLFSRGSASGLQSRWGGGLFPRNCPLGGDPKTRLGQDCRGSLLPSSRPLFPPLVSPPSPCSRPLSTPSRLEESFQSQWKVKLGEGKKTGRDQKGCGKLGSGGARL